MAENPSPMVELNVLNQISRTLIRQHDVDAMLQEVLDILNREMGLLRGTVTLKRGNELRIAASQGLSEEERMRGRYFLGEGITGAVALSNLKLSGISLATRTSLTAPRPDAESPISLSCAHRLSITTR